MAPAVNLPISTQFTLEAWVKRTSDNDTYQTIMSDASPSYSQAMFTVYVDAGNQDYPAGPSDEFAYYQTADNSVHCSGVSADINIWHHVAVSRDGDGTRRFFVDGGLSATTTGSPAPADSDGVFTIGRAGSFVGEYFAGLIDEVRISNTAVYTTNFTPPAAALTATSATAALFHFNEGSGQTAADSSGNNRHATLGTSTNPDVADPVWTGDNPVN